MKGLQFYTDEQLKRLKNLEEAERQYLKTLPYDNGLSVKQSSGKYFDFGGVMSGINSVSKSVLNDSLDTTYEDLKRQKEYNNRSVLSGVSDNDALLMAMDNLQWGQKYTGKDFRSESVWDDVSDTIMGGIAGASATNSPWGFLAAVPVAGRKIADRIRAGKEARKGNEDLSDFNTGVYNKLSQVADKVDTINDRRLLESFYNSAAFGGDLNTHGADWDNGLTYINAGGTHESNPYDGVPAGTDESGVPNLVEEGEVIWDNQYVFSNRLKVPKKLLNKYKLGGPLTYADAIKKVTKESEERKNDPISNATTKAIVNEFIDSQEEVRMKKQQRAAAKVQQAQFEADLLNALAGLGGEEQSLAPMDMQAPVQQAPQEAPVIEQMGAYGGNLFKGGGTIPYDRSKSVDTVREFENQTDYKNFLSLVRDNPEIASQWISRLNSGEFGSLNGYEIKDIDDWYRLATDGKLGPIHNATLAAAQAWKKGETPDKTKSRITDTSIERYKGVHDTDVVGNSFDTVLSPAIIIDDAKRRAIDSTIRGTKDIAELNATTKDEVVPFEYKSTWGRNAPIYGALAGALYGLTGSPNYHNADKILEAAEQIGMPVSIPVETIGDYVQRRPFDERYLVNMANQNRAAASRSAANTAGGNRAMQLGADAFLAHSNQQELGEIMRQAYLANRQDEFNTAEFNRDTNLQNMSAINQRNISQAQLNSQRQQAMLSGLERGYSLRQQIKSDWDSATQQSLNSLYESLGNRGKEAEEYNTMVSMAQHGYSPYYYGNNGIIQFTPQGQYKAQPIDFWQPNGNLDFSVDYLGWKPRALGGNKKKRRF